MDYLTVPSVAAGVAPISTSTTSAQSAVLKEGDYVCVVTALTFALRGSNPTATNQCLPIPANIPVILRGIQEGEKVAFILPTGTGTAYLCRQP